MEEEDYKVVAKDRFGFGTDKYATQKDMMRRFGTEEEDHRDLTVGGLFDYWQSELDWNDEFVVFGRKKYGGGDTEIGLTQYHPHREEETVTNHLVGQPATIYNTQTILIIKIFLYFALANFAIAFAIFGFHICTGRKFEII